MEEEEKIATITATIITIILFIGAGAWVFWMAYWMLGRFGIWQWATYRRLKKRYNDDPFDDKVVEWCLAKMDRKWRYKDIRTILKYEKDKGDVLYTWLSLSKLGKVEINELLERRSNNGRQKNIGVKEESSRTLPSF